MSPDKQRIEELEDAITDAGLILSAVVNDESEEAPMDVVKRAIRRLGEAMKDPAIMKRQGI